MGIFHLFLFNLINSLGVIPNCFMKHEVKYEVVENPKLSATSLIRRSPLANISAAFFNRHKRIKSLGAKEVDSFHFSTKFKLLFMKQFGITPSEFIKLNKNK